MLPSPGWFVFFTFLLLEVCQSLFLGTLLADSVSPTRSDAHVQTVVVLILVAPMPSNDIRGAVLNQMVKAWQKQGVRVGCWIMVALAGLYFVDSVSTLWSQPFLVPTCEQRELLMFTERNAFATGKQSCAWL